MPQFDLVCSACGRRFRVEAETAPEDEVKRCPECGSACTRQTFESFLRNGPLLDPKWGRPIERSGCG